jgi:hypothetical protein
VGLPLPARPGRGRGWREAWEVAERPDRAQVATRTTRPRTALASIGQGRLDGTDAPFRLFDLFRGPHFTLLLFDGPASTRDGYDRLRTTARQVRTVLGDDSGWGRSPLAQGPVRVQLVCRPCRWREPALGRAARGGCSVVLGRRFLVSDGS